MALFRLQAACVPVYRAYVKHLHIVPEEVVHVTDIPFLPIRYFKSHRVLADGHTAETIFESSRTTGQQASTHFVHSLPLYLQSCVAGFEHAYGPMENYRFLFLLPGYLERPNASLVAMAEHFAECNGQSRPTFFLRNYEGLSAALDELTEKKTLLLGVTFALLDFANARRHPLPPNTLVMETGGMKGRGREPIREELHAELCERLGVQAIHAEYGMTELLSQGYAQGGGMFATPPWMRIIIRETNDPFSYAENRTVGGVNVVDLANVFSCAFIETQDLGRMHPNGRFEILGRFDASEVRGCSLMAV